MKEYASVRDSEISTKNVSLKPASAEDLPIGYREEMDLYMFLIGNQRNPFFIIANNQHSSSLSFVDFNKCFCDKLGYTREELLKINPADIFAPETLQLIEKDTSNNYGTSNIRMEGVVLTKECKKLPVEIKSCFYKNEKQSLRFVFLNDLSFNKQSEIELHYHSSLLLRAEFVGKMGYWEYDVRNKRIWASHGARKIYGFDEIEISLEDIKNTVFPDYRPELDKMLDKLINQNEKHEIEIKIFSHNNGDIKNIRYQAEYDPTEEKIFGIIQDITLQKNAEKELLEAKEKAEESDRLKAAFVSNMSHEIRTPMNGIVGFAHLLTEVNSDAETRNEYKKQIHLCCNQLLEKVNDILDISKIESGQVVINKGEVNINTLLKGILESYDSMATKKKLKIHLNCPDSSYEPILITDCSKLNKILIILIDNAIKFTSSGFVEFGYRLENPNIEFYVKDTGIGISPMNHETIFQAFNQAHSEISLEFGGTGLGLTIAKTYVNMLGGRIWLDSESGKGSTFFFTLPGVKNSIKQEDRFIVKKKFSQPKLSLVVEDMEMNYIYLKALLEPLGFSVIWAKDGDEGIEMALKNDNIDLVLMDIRLPTTDGYEATRIIKEKRPDLPVIAQTANALLDERKKALDSGCNDYITKPIYKEEFKKTLSTFFDI